jgi:hypothetical protein
MDGTSLSPDIQVVTTVGASWVVAATNVTNPAP